MRPISDSAGFTLVEMIIVMAVTAVVGAMVAVFLRGPIESYVAQDRRAGLVDAADTALRRMQRDIRLALPNSVRVNSLAGGPSLVFLGTRAGGRYRAEGGGDILDFTTTDAGFDVLGPGLEMRTGDRIAVYNLGIPGADAWAGVNMTTYTGGNVASTNDIAITPIQFPLASPGNRFQVVDGPVAYQCNLAAGTLTRFWGYDPFAGIIAATPRALLATGVSACTFTYQAGVTERGGLVSMTLELTDDGESVRLYATTQVSNQP